MDEAPPSPLDLAALSSFNHHVINVHGHHIYTNRDHHDILTTFFNLELRTRV